MIRTLSAAHIAASIVVLSALSVPLLTSAVTDTASQTELRATIRSAIMTDPRAVGMSAAQVDAMVDVLTTEAGKQGVTTHDILWRPTLPAPAVEEGVARFNGVPFLDACGDASSVLCQLNHALGLDGTNILIPAILGIAALVMLGILWLLVAHHRMHGHLNPAAVRTPPPLF